MNTVARSLTLNTARKRGGRIDGVPCGAFDVMPRHGDIFEGRVARATLREVVIPNNAKQAGPTVLSEGQRSADEGPTKGRGWLMAQRIGYDGGAWSEEFGPKDFVAVRRFV
jgi:hypothetical protein